jgi:hypothetical protein
MKALVLSFAVFAAIATVQTAHADYNTDGLDRTITCKAGNLSVSINARRTQITVTSAYDPAHPDTYLVGKRDTDGDTFVSYVAQDDAVTLSFDDQGDSVYFKDSNQTSSVKCPQ